MNIKFLLELAECTFSSKKISALIAEQDNKIITAFKNQDCTEFRQALSPKTKYANETVVTLY